MKKRLLAITLVLALITTFLLPALPALPIEAAESGGVRKGQTEELEPGWQRVNPHSKVHTLRTFTDAQGRQMAEREIIISSLPATLEDNRTLIDTNWYLLTDRSGQNVFQTGVNTFTARVLDGRVSVEDGSGKLAVWNPKVSIGGKKFSGGTAKIDDDFISDDYEGNVLKWEYGNYSDGWWILGNNAPLVRYLRVIEDYIAESWVLPMDPKASVYIDLNEKIDADYGRHFEWLKAFDADGLSLEVTKNMAGIYVISASEFSGKTYPVTIDPDSPWDIRTSSYDGMLYNSSSSYNTTRTASSGSFGSSTIGSIGQWKITNYYVERFMVMFDTDFYPYDPGDVIIDAAALYLYGHVDSSDTDFYITVQSGMPTYPHRPPQSSDYYYVRYSGNGGQRHTSDFYTGTYNIVNLNSTGESWINKSGWTKFMLRSSRDIAGNTPTGKEDVTIRCREYSTSYAPELRIVFHIPVVAPQVTTQTQTNVTETSAKLKGYLSDDGNEPCLVNFRYQVYGGGNQYTSPMDGYTTGTYFNYTQGGLPPGKRISFWARAANAHSTVEGSELKFMTYPNPANAFSATGEENQIALVWNKGTGAQKTMIRRAEGSYPTTPTSGTQIYFDTGTSHDDTTAVPGTTYYYSAWSYATEDGLTAYSQTKVTSYAQAYTLGVPDVTTNAATDVTTTTATLNLYLNDLGGYATTDVSFQYHPDGGDWGDYYTAPAEKSAPGSYSIPIDTLTIDTLYHVRAKATNTAGPVYGSDVPFTTNAPSAPTMLTQAATGVQLTSVTLHGKVTDDGDAEVTGWFEYGLTTEYEKGPTPTGAGYFTNDTFSWNLGNLEPSTTYHYRAVGENSVDIGYGADQEFETATPTAPSLNTGDATEVGSNQATLHGDLTDDGGVPCEVQFQWGTDVGYGTDTGWQTGFTTDMDFSHFVAGLTVGETYHFRAQARNAGGTTDGADKQFTTKFTPPADFTCKAISSNTVTAAWVKAGDQTYIRYKQTGFPVDREDGIVVPPGLTPGEIASVSGLLPGTTYYFRAWSWREGDVWAEGYAEDVATTSPTVAGATLERPEGVAPMPEALPEMFQEPSGTALEKMPFYELGTTNADSFGLPHGAFWFLIAMYLAVVAGVATLLLPPHEPYAAVFVGCAVSLCCAVLGMITGWYVIIYAVIAVGIVFAVTMWKRGTI